MSESSSNKYQNISTTQLQLVEKKELETEYKRFFVKPELVKLFNEFCNNLTNLLHSSYLGKDYLKTDKDILGHFNWVLDTVIENYANIGIIFHDKESIHKYFFNHFLTNVYNNNDYGDSDIQCDIEFFHTLMNYDEPKLRKELVLMIELFLIFYKSLHGK